MKTSWRDVAIAAFGVLALLAVILLSLPAPEEVTFTGPPPPPGTGICESEEPPEELDWICKSGELVVLTRNAPTTVFLGRDGPEGFEFALTQAFAHYLGVTVRYRLRHSISEILDEIEKGRADIAAAGLTMTDTRMEKFDFSPSYLAVRQQVVCNRDISLPKRVEDLVDVNLKVIADSSYEERLAELAENIDRLEWTSTVKADTEEVLQHVAEGKVDCTVADSTIVSINRRYYPELVVAFPLGDEDKLAWIIAEGRDGLGSALKSWLGRAKKSGLLTEFEHRYFGYIRKFDYVDTVKFHQRIENRLPQFEGMFRRAGDANGFDWRFLAAVAYQESHWEPEARSKTGVRGIMMLTRQTAERVGVTDRLDPRQSIAGGAAYLAELMERLPDDIKPQDRKWFALAAYNLGMGHVYDARGLAAKLGKSRSSWVEFREVLPLLQRAAHYKELRYGYARGGEAVQFVDRVRLYYDILRHRG